MSLLLCSAATVAQSPQNILVTIQVDPGTELNPLGLTGDNTFSTPRDHFDVTHRTFDRDIESVEIDFGGFDWELVFAAPARMPLAPGLYENPQQSPFESPRRPGISLILGGYGFCGGSLGGEFTVLEAEYAADGTVERLAIDFEVHCQQQPPGVFGFVRINSAVATPTPRPVTPTPAPDKTYLSLSGSDVFSGGGPPLLYTLNDGSFLEFHHLGGVRILFHGGGDWDMTFEVASGPVCAELVPGVYEDADRASFARPGHPGLDVGGNGAGCDQLGGRFTVYRVEYGLDGHVETFIADFEQRCEYAAPPLYGSIHYEAFRPTPTPPPPTPTPPPGSATSFVLLQSEPGDFIGSCAQHLLTLADGAFAATHDPGHVSITYDGGTDDRGIENLWEFDLAAPQGTELLPGRYDGAIRYRFQSPGQPGLQVDGQGRGCDGLTGGFTVLAAEYGPTGTVERFEADFEQHCCDSSEVCTPPPPLVGMIRLNSTTPIPTSTVTAGSLPTPTATPSPSPSATVTETPTITPALPSGAGGGCALAPAGSARPSAGALVFLLGSVLTIRWPRRREY